MTGAEAESAGVVVASGYTSYQPEQNWLLVRRRAVLIALLATAFAARVAVRAAFGEQYFWTNGYAAYYDIATNIAGGKGFCLRNACAWLPPLYPLFLTISVLAGKSLWLVIVPQAVIGSGTALCAYLIGREIFDSRAALIACAITAFYPYYVMHDTALQETGTVTFCTALAVWLLLRARRSNGNLDWLLAGIVLGTVQLARASATLTIIAGILWCICWGASGGVSEKLRKAAVLAFAAVVTVSPWLLHTYRSTGTPIVTSQVGMALWMGNNPDTFSYYPAESIDRSHAQAFRDLSAADRAELAKLAHDEIATSNWYAQRALEFMRENPLLVAQGAVRKLAAGFSWRLNPYRDAVAEAAYSIGYVPVIVFGIWGMLLAREEPGTPLIGLLILAYCSVTAIFWSHTSHRSYLDVYLIVFAASVIDRAWRRLELHKMTAAHPTSPENQNKFRGTARPAA